MTLYDYIQNNCPEYLVANKASNVIEEIMKADFLPYDKIGTDADGQLCKLVEVDDDRDISVHELIGYTREEIVRSGDLALLNCYDIYMMQVSVEDVNVMDMMKLAEQWKVQRQEADGDGSMLC